MQKRTYTRPNPNLRVVVGGRSGRRINPWRLGLFSAGVVTALALGLWFIAPSLAPSRAPFGPDSTVRADLPFTLGRPDPTLVPRLQTLTSLPRLRTGVFVLDLQSGAFVTQGDDVAFAAASTIKIPVLLALLQDVDRGLVDWNESLTLNATVRVSGSGFLQYRPLGTRRRVWEVAGLMITESDNAATEMLIARLGGRERLNQRFRWWGLNHTALRSPLPDIAGTNTTSPRDLGMTLALLDRGAGLSPWTRERGLDWLKRVTNRSLFPTGLMRVEPSARIAHKTGTIGIALSDAGLVDLPNGKRYILAAMVERPREDRRAVKLLQDISTLVAQVWSAPASTPALTDSLSRPLPPAPPQYPAGHRRDGVEEQE
ncbi:serine hydrolase [Candidatus Cyanaurora vandensis]|uniref:serine hydrolase n=1 Tax=Candidatus Cyanaurora vandensis TaxID=2714958 RepID=UPI00257F37B6|nr:serine hydrolase [Candidatus Cyanaurora vandensis]